MEVEKSMESFLRPNVQLDRFDGTNFTRWKKKLFFLLTVLKIAYVLDPNLEPFQEPKEDDYDKVKAERKKRKDGEVGDTFSTCSLIGFMISIILWSL